MPTGLIGDPGRLHQIMGNLGENAVKFTEEGGVFISVTVEEEKESSVVLHFIISDTGAGIQPDKMETIFDIFNQGDGSATRKYGGTGLGLALTRQIVQVMGGRIWAESPSDCRLKEETESDRNDHQSTGSTFHVTLPFRLKRAGDVSLADADKLREREVFDFSRAMEAVGGDMELFIEIAALFLDDFNKKIGQIREGIQTGDLRIIEEAVDSLKGASRNVGAKQLEMSLVGLERTVKDGIPQGSEIDLSELRQGIEAFREALKERGIILED